MLSLKVARLACRLSAKPAKIKDVAYLQNRTDQAAARQTSKKTAR